MQNVGKGFVAGFVATLVLSALMLAKDAMGLMPALDVPGLLGVLLGRDRMVGWIGHFAIGILIWGTVFAWVEPLLPTRTYWLKGAVFGMFAWLLMMIVFMPLVDLGLFASRLGLRGPLATFVLHVIYGYVLGAVFGIMRPSRATSIPEGKVASDLSGRAKAERQIEGGS